MLGHQLKKKKTQQKTFNSAERMIPVLTQQKITSLEVGTASFVCEFNFPFHYSVSDKKMYLSEGNCLKSAAFFTSNVTTRWCHLLQYVLC